MTTSSVLAGTPVGVHVVDELQLAAVPEAVFVTACKGMTNPINTRDRMKHRRIFCIEISDFFNIILFIEHKPMSLIASKNLYKTFYFIYL
jgi:hypothetical protein